MSAEHRGADGGRPYIERLRDESARFAQDLLQENERLRLLASEMTAALCRIEDQIAAISRSAGVSSPEAETKARLEASLAQAASEKGQLAAGCEELQRRSANLANLYVATYRLHGTLARAEVLDVILEILANLVGSEQVAVFERSAEGDTLQLVAHVGIDEQRFLTWPVSKGAIGLAVGTREILLAGPDTVLAPAETGLTACIPLLLEGRVTGAIAVFALLPQKAAGIEPIDRELFDLLASQAATALYCATLHERSGRSGAEA